MPTNIWRHRIEFFRPGRPGVLNLCTPVVRVPTVLFREDLPSANLFLHSSNVITKSEETSLKRKGVTVFPDTYLIRVHDNFLV
jgi:hypothetical protein